jgi:hypothetical protein
MEQLFELNLEIVEGADVENVRLWLDVVLAGKVEFQYFLPTHANNYSGWHTIEGRLFIKNSSAISGEELTEH